MGIKGLLKKVELKMDQIEQKRYVKKAQALEGLRKQRVALEGRARIIETENRERARIKKAKQTIKDNPTGFRKVLKNVGKGLEEAQQRSKKKEPPFVISTGKNPWR